MNVDSLIDVCAAIGEMESGRETVAHLRVNHNVPLSICGSGIKKGSDMSENLRPSWSRKEEAFLRENLGKMSMEEIGVALGRTANAVKVRQVRKQIHSASKRPGYLTGHQLSKLFRVDVHAVMLWRDRGILEFEVIPGDRKILNVSMKRVYRWAVQPRNWLYFKVERIRDPHLRKLVMLAQERWGDEWWSIGQAARFHGVDNKMLNARLHAGKIPGVQWGNWWLRKSDVVAHVFYTGKGAYKKAQEAHQNYSPGADAWILRARDELGMQFKDIAGRMKGDWSTNSVMYRYHKLTSGQGPSAGLGGASGTGKGE